MQINSIEAIGSQAFINIKGRQVSTALITLVAEMVEIERPYLLLHAGDALAIDDIFHPMIWRTLTLSERRSAGLCLSWLVDQGLAPLVKLPKRRGNTLLYRPQFTH